MTPAIIGGLYFLGFLIFWIVVSKKLYAIDYDDPESAVALAFVWGLVWPIVLIFMGVIKGAVKLFRLKR